MNFLKAIQHATIGYGIRRKCWGPKAILSLDNFARLYWLNSDCRLSAIFVQETDSYNLSLEDINSTDWETV